MNCANHPDRERVAFCQNCGKPLCQECMRAVGSAVFCEPCLAVKIGAAGVAPPPTGSYASGAGAGAGSYGYADPATGGFGPGMASPGMMPIPPSSSLPNAPLAAFLGFIPGVGAMYNEQYAKGVVHLIVFAVLVSLTDNHDIFGLFVAGWEFYMAFDAYHTARARRDGAPLPNPFGLNDLGEKLGFGKAWAAAPTTAGAAPADPYGTSAGAAYAAPYTAPSTPPPYTPPGAASFVPGATTPGWNTPPTPGWEQYAPPMPPIPPMPGVPMDAQVPYPGNRFPAGAIWLIGLGALFLFGNIGWFHGVSFRLFLPLLFIGLAVFVFVRKMTSYGGGLADDGTAGYRLRIFRALRGSAWLALLGLLFFLDEFHILTWGHSWPLFIILAGLMTVFERTAYNSAAAAPPYVPGYGYATQPVAPQAPAAETTTSIVPASTHDTSHDITHDTSHDQEGR